MRFIIHRLETCASTNDTVRALAAAGAPEGTVVVADEQTAGRGTKGRGWNSPRGLGLYASILLRPASPAVVPLLPLAAGIAARDAVEASHGLAARIRWPNDILFEGRKLGGVLCESVFAGDRPEFVIVGIGLNAAQGSEAFPGDLRETAVSIASALGAPADRERLFDALLAAVDRRLDSLFRGGIDELIRAVNDCSAVRPGDPILVSADADPRVKPGALTRAPASAPAAAAHFSYEGIGRDGSLLVRDASGRILRFASAEVRKVL